LGTLADEIEKYIKKMLDRSMEGFLEVKRNDLAAMFLCVPSQINYVLETRFTNEQGYHVESRRGEGGYLRIIKLGVKPGDDLLTLVNSTIGKMISQQSGEGLINRLEEENFLTKREGVLIRGIIDKNALGIGQPEQDLLRARILRSVLISLLREDL
jgi:transcriptional regulator CtsR